MVVQEQKEREGAIRKKGDDLAKPGKKAKRSARIAIEFIREKAKKRIGFIFFFLALGPEQKDEESPEKVSEKERERIAETHRRSFAKRSAKSS